MSALIDRPASREISHVQAIEISRSFAQALSMPNTRPRRRKAPLDHDPRAFRQARIRAGWRQGDLAREIGVVQSVLSEAERGTRGISPIVRVKAAKVLTCDPITFEPLEVNA